jgi:peroxiredoxin
MAHVLTRLAAVVAASLCSIALAGPQSAPVPEAIRPMLDMLHIGEVSSVTLLDEQGKPVDADTFARRQKELGAFNMTKKPHEGGGPDVTLRLLSKDQAAVGKTPATKLKVGDSFPEFSLARLDGTAIDNEALAGRYTLVSFYFAQCAPCVKEVPTLNALAERHKNINVLAVTFDSVAESKRFVEEHHLSWPIVPDARKLLTDTIGLRGFPAVALLDPQGKVVEFKMGGDAEHDAATLEGWAARGGAN